MNCPQKLNIPSRTPGKRRWGPTTRGCPFVREILFGEEEPVNNMQLQFLITSEQRASGAMFMESLNETVLAFIYPTDGTRTFHTFFCPPMRIMCA
jgi:hypothetical protein